MSCKSPRDEIGHKTTLAILNKLSNYEWNAKAVLTMAAFALEYSEFWMHASSVPTILLQNLWLYWSECQCSQGKQHFKSIAKPSLRLTIWWKQRCKSLKLIIFELEKLTNDLGVAIEQISVDVYWAIITIVSLTTRIDCLTTESYVTYVHFILSYIIKPNYFIAMKILKCIILLII